MTMAIVWVVTVGDQERNFRRRRDAVAWLRRLTHDDRPFSPVVKEDAWRYRFYGPGDDLRFRTCAVIDKVAFPPRRFYLPKTRRKRRREEAMATNAMDPHGDANTGGAGCQ